MMKPTILRNIVITALVFFFGLQNQAQNKPQYTISKIRQLIPQEIDSALFYAKDLLHFPVKGSDSLIAISHYFQGIAYYYKGYYYISSEHYHKALLTDFSNQNLKFKGKIYNNLGVNYDMTDQYQLALSAYKESMKLELEFEDSYGVAQSNINIGLLYFNLKQYDEGLKYIHLALEYFLKENDHQGIGLCYQNLALLNTEKKNHREALDYLLKAHSSFLNSGDTYERCVNLNNLIGCASELGYLEDANEFLEESKQIAIDNNYDFLLELNMLSEAELSLKTKDYEKAKTILTALDPTNLRTTLRKKQLNLHIQIANATADKINESIQKYSDFRDSIDHYQTNQLIHELKNQYHLEIDDLSQQLDQTKQEQSNQFRIFISLMLLIILLFVFSIVLIKRK